jgi:hypothetical protein
METSSGVSGNAISLAGELKMAEKRFKAVVNSEELASMMSPLKPAFLRPSTVATISTDVELSKSFNENESIGTKVVCYSA